MNKKYELTSELIHIGNFVVLYRIRALKDFGNVKAGDLGGCIAYEANLNPYGNCWVYDNAWVYENAHVSSGAKVSGDTKVYGNVKVYGNAWVGSNAEVFGSAHICGHAGVYETAKVYDEALIFGDAEISEFACIYGTAKISGNAKVYGNAWIYDDARVSGDAQVYGNARIYNNAKVQGTARISKDTQVCGRTCLSRRDDSIHDTLDKDSTMLERLKVCAEKNAEKRACDAEQDLASSLEIGDIVTLKSGGPQMTITAIDGNNYTSIWYDTELHTIKLPLACLIQNGVV